MGSSREDLCELPEEVQDEIGYALHQAQMGGKSDKAKPFKGFEGVSVLEIVVKNFGEAYRALYTVEFEKVIAVLHVFQKKSKHGIKTPQQEVNLIKSRFKDAKEAYAQWLKEQGKTHEKTQSKNKLKKRLR